MKMTDIVEKLTDLHKQATLERSHYYVGSVVREAADEIERLRKELEFWKRHTKKLTDEIQSKFEDEYLAHWDTKEELAKCRKQLEQAQQWQEIETAEKSEALLGRDKNGYIFEMEYQEHLSRWVNYWANVVVYPTHWMPLPHPPKTGEGN